MSAAATRRTVLGSIAMAPLAMAAPALAMGVGDEFDALVCAYRKAWQEHEDACKRVSNIEEIWFARQPQRPTITISKIVDVEGRKIPFDVPFGKNDLWVAATANVTGARLHSTDRDFDPKDPLFIARDWIDPTP